MISLFRMASIRRMLAEDSQLIAVASSPDLQMELTAVHGVEKERTGLLYCLEGVQVAMLDRKIYESLKAEEGDLIGRAEEHRQDQGVAVEVPEGEA